MKRWEWWNKRRYYAFATNLFYGNIIVPHQKIFFFLALRKKFGLSVAFIQDIMKRWEFCSKRPYYAFATNLFHGHIMVPPKKNYFFSLALRKTIKLSVALTLNIIKLRECYNKLRYFDFERNLLCEAYCTSPKKAQRTNPFEWIYPLVKIYIG